MSREPPGYYFGKRVLRPECSCRWPSLERRTVHFSHLPACCCRAIPGSIVRAPSCPSSLGIDPSSLLLLSHSVVRAPSCPSSLGIDPSSLLLLSHSVVRAPSCPSSLGIDPWRLFMNKSSSTTRPSLTMTQYHSERGTQNAMHSLPFIGLQTGLPGRKTMDGAPTSLFQNGMGSSSTKAAWWN